MHVSPKQVSCSVRMYIFGGIGPRTQECHPPDHCGSLGQGGGVHVGVTSQDFEHPLQKYELIWRLGKNATKWCFELYPE